MVAGPKERRLQAAESANRLLMEAGIDQSRRVDVFGLCEQLGLWLAFLPLDNLLGSYLPEGSGGALITTQRPVSIQRYTAAHELGHWRLHHDRGPILDNDEQVLGHTQDESEQLAQIFAAALLMPPPLVYGTLERLGVEDDVSPVHAYTVAREAGVSYEAAVRQLANLNVISGFEAGELLRTRPITVKTEIGRGQRPAVGTADVWPVDEQWHGQRLRVHADDEVVVALPENRSTGYRWFFAGHEPCRELAPEPSMLQPAGAPGQLDLSEDAASFAARMRQGRGSKSARVPRAAVDLAREAGSETSYEAVEIDGGSILVGDRYVTSRVPEASSRGARRARLARLADTVSSAAPWNLEAMEAASVGGTGRRILTVRFHRPGPAQLRLRHRSAYAAVDDEIGRYALDVDVAPRRRGLSIEQLLTAQDSEWANHVREREGAYASSDREPDSSPRGS